MKNIAKVERNQINYHFNFVPFKNWTKRNFNI